MNGDQRYALVAPERKLGDKTRLAGPQIKINWVNKISRFRAAGFVIVADMYFVYVLFSRKDGKLYIGYTSDLEARMTRHQKGLVPATRNRISLELIGYEAYLTMSDAKRRERFLKGGKGREQLKIQYLDIFQKLGYRFR